MMKVMMVCLGNICRSPLAEGIMQHKADQAGLDVEVHSAGTGSWHIGNAPDRRSEAVAHKNGIDISHQRAQKFARHHFAEFDHIFAMDQENYYDILSLAESDEDRQKVRMILNVSNPGSNMPVPDPYYGGDQGFDHVFQLLDDACEALIKEWS